MNILGSTRTWLLSSSPSPKSATSRCGACPPFGFDLIINLHLSLSIHRHLFPVLRACMFFRHGHVRSCGTNCNSMRPILPGGLQHSRSWIRKPVAFPHHERSGVFKTVYGLLCRAYHSMPWLAPVVSVPIPSPSPPAYPLRGGQPGLRAVSQIQHRIVWPP